MPVRLPLVVPLLVFILPTASAGIPVPVSAGADVREPTDECPTCAGATLSAGVRTPSPGCMDCPAFGVIVQADRTEAATTGRVAVCYSGIMYNCFVDVPIGP